MEVKVCKNCRKLFNYVYGPDLCPECAQLVQQSKLEEKEPVNRLTAALKPMVKEDEEKYEKVRDYVMTHAKATIMQIAEANDINPSKLFEWIREERLEFSDDSKHVWFECEICGAKIKSGRRCFRCKGK